MEQTNTTEQAIDEIKDLLLSNGWKYFEELNGFRKVSSFTLPMFSPDQEESFDSISDGNIRELAQAINEQLIKARIEQLKKLKRSIANTGDYLAEDTSDVMIDELEDQLNQQDSKEEDIDHIDDLAKKAEPTKPLSVDEILAGFGRWVAGEFKPDGQTAIDHVQAKARLIELVESLPQLEQAMHSCNLKETDCLDCVRNRLRGNIEQALIKAIKGGER